MKSLRLALFALIVSFAVVNLAQADGFHKKPKKCVNIVYAQAVQDLGLMGDMNQQLSAKFLEKIQHLYLVNVVHDGVLYRILGSRQQWLTFFERPWQKMDVKTYLQPKN